MDENMTSVNNLEVAIPEAEVTSEVTETVDDVANHQQTAEDNAKFAERRRKQELDQARERLSSANKRLADYEALESSLKASGFTGSVAEIADQISANARGVSIETIRSEREAREAEAAIRSERDMYKAELNKVLINKDLDKIKAKYPNIEVMDDLPDGFIEIMATGKVKDPLLAYEMLTPKKDTPVSTGSVKSNDKQTKEYFTREEVSRMSKSDVKTNYDKIRESMKKW